MDGSLLGNMTEAGSLGRQKKERRNSYGVVWCILYGNSSV